VSKDGGIISKDVTKPLSVPLTDEDILKYGRDCARAQSDKDRIISEAKSVAKDYAAQVSEQDAIIAKLSPRINSGKETRDVVCYQVSNWNTGRVIVSRSDTGEVIEDRPMREEEKQREMVIVEK
jgi:hypothetical protein